MDHTLREKRATARGMGKLNFQLTCVTTSVGDLTKGERMIVGNIQKIIETLRSSNKIESKSTGT